MTGPRIPLAVPDLRGRERELLVKCVEENWVSSAGPEVTAFEQALAELTGRKCAVAVVNGTAALHLSLLAAGVRKGDRVIVPDWTFAATANAVSHAGAEPVFVDVTEEDWSIDPGLVDAALSKDPSIKAVIAVDPLGHAAQFDRLRAACSAKNVPLIEDAAGAIGGTYRGKPCGALGDISIFSFNGNKTVTAGGGGMVLTDDESMARHVRHISTQARPGRDYEHDAIGYNYRMTNINAAVGLAQVERLGEMVAMKQRIAGRYDEAVTARGDMTPMPRPANSVSSCWLYSVRLASATAARSLVAALERSGVESRIFWRSLSAQKPWQGAPHLLNGVSLQLSGTIVSLPSSSSLSDAEQDRVLQILQEWRGENLRAA